MSNFSDLKQLRLCHIKQHQNHVILCTMYWWIICMNVQRGAVHFYMKINTNPWNSLGENRLNKINWHQVLKWRLTRNQIQTCCGECNLHRPCRHLVINYKVLYNIYNFQSRQYCMQYKFGGSCEKNMYKADNETVDWQTKLIMRTIESPIGKSLEI